MGAAGIPVAGLHGRRAAPAVLAEGLPAVTAGPLPATLATATIVLVAVRDEQLTAALAELSAAALAPGALAPGALAPGAVVLHASGSLDPRAALDRLRAAGHPAGTFHPLIPLADPSRAPALVRGGWIGVDGDAAAVRAAESLAEPMGARVLAIPAAGRAAYHAAAVIASNFPTILAALASRLMQQSGVEPVIAWDAVRHLMVAATANLAANPPHAALVGPVSRGDVETIERHLGVLRDDPDLLPVYVALSRAALPLAVEQGLDPAALARIRALLEVSPSR
jgi:predicted short-subunit dehydrogenase-like oxidoreductase (DUF2520 family)